MQFCIRLLLLVCVMMAGCAREPQPLVDEHGVVCPLSIPCSYRASIPCLECGSNKVSISLRRDHLYFLRVITVLPESGKEQIKTETGIWKYQPEKNTLLLTSYQNVARLLFISPDKTLRVLRVSGGILPQIENYTLFPDTTGTVYEDVVRLKGMYTYVDDASVFTECLSGVSFPVAMEADNINLERSYLRIPHGFGEPVLVKLDAQIVERPSLKSFGYQEVVVPVHYLAMQPGIECNGRKSTQLRLVENSWHLIELDGNPLVLPEGVRQPFLFLTTRGHKMRGFSGCNRFTGSYLSMGNIFLFNKLYVRRMACVGGVEIEEQFYKVLSAVESYTIEGNILELQDENGVVRARLQHGEGE